MMFTICIKMQKLKIWKITFLPNNDEVKYKNVVIGCQREFGKAD